MKPLLEKLLTLRAAVPDLQEKKSVGVLEPYYGICGNIYTLCDLSNHAEVNKINRGLRTLMDAWPGRCRDQDYPVGGMEQFGYEMVNSSFWQNQRRIELLDWMIKELQE